MNASSDTSAPSPRGLRLPRRAASSAADPVTFRNSIAAVIGIDEYGPGIPRLSTAVADAEQLGEILGKSHGYDVRLLTRDASLARLSQLFCTELPQALGPDDRLLVYFAGHGVALDGDGGPRGFLIPQDARAGEQATFLPMTDLHGWLDALPCRHMLAILDCCFAGAFRWSTLRAIEMPPSVVHRERYERYLRSPAWQVLTSAAYDQQALDVLSGQVLGARDPSAAGAGKMRHSPFAEALFAALAGEGDLIPRGRGDGVITATELYLYLRERVETEAEAAARHEQTPGLWALNKQRKGEYVFLVPGKEVNLPPAPAVTMENNPYRGLRSYETVDADLFFGRADEVEALAAAVEANPFVAVVGASGTGKSSLVKAGLLPRLAAPHADRPSRWRVTPAMRPTNHPLQALAATLSAEEPGAPAGAAAPPLETPAGLSNWVAKWAAAHPGMRLLLTVDQLEELATVCRDDAERDAFLAALAAALAAHDEVFRVVITVRLDFEQQFAGSPSPLAAHWAAGRFVVSPLAIDELRQIIEGPASLRVLYFDPPEMVDDLIKDVIQTPGALPLLSFSLSELYIKYVESGRDDRSLKLEDYRALGGVVGALRNRANQEYDALPDDAHRETMKRVMLRMVATEGGELARRRVPLSELVYPSPAEQERVNTVLNRMVEARLLVRGSEPGPGGAAGPAAEPYVEPAHDALILSWDRLLLWRKDAEEYLPLQRRLAQAAAEWQAAPLREQQGLLWDDNPRLPQAEVVLWPQRRQKGLAGARASLRTAGAAPADTRWLNRDEVAFVRASVDERARFYRRIVSIATTVVAVLAAIAIFALIQRQNAVTQEGRANTNAAEAQANAVQAANNAATAVSESNARATEVVVRTTAQVEAQNNAATAVAENKVARARALALNSIRLVNEDPELARLLAIESAKLAHTNEGEIALRDAVLNRSVTVFRGQKGWLNSVSLSPDNRLALSGATDGVCYLWEVASGTELWHVSGGSSCSGKITADGRYAVIATDQVRFYDMATGQLVGEPEAGIGADPAEFIFSQDGQSFWGGSALWLVPGGRRRVSLPITKDDLQVVSQDLSLVATQHGGGAVDIVSLASGKYVEQWQLPAGEKLKGLRPGDRQVLTSADDALRLRRISDGGEAQKLDKGYVAQFSPDGSLLAVANGGNIQVYKWDETGFKSNGSWRAHDEYLDEVRFTPDSAFILTSVGRKLDFDIKVWDPRTINPQYLANPLVAALSGNSSWVNDMDFSRDSTLVASAGDDKIVRVWTLAADRPSAMLPGSANAGESFRRSFTADGRLVVTVEGDAAHISDFSTGRQVQVLASPGITVTAASLTPDGARVVTTGGAAAVLWDVATGKLVAKLAGQPGSVVTAAISPDGRLVATRDGGPAISLWDATTGDLVRTLPAGDKTVDRLVWSEDGSLIGATTDRGIVLFVPGTGDQISVIPSQARGFALSPDSRTLVTTQPPSVWDVKSGEKQFELVGGHSSAVLDAVFSPDGSRIASVDNDGTAFLWDARSGRPVTQMLGHVYTVPSIAFSPDGRFVVTASEDSTSRIWDTAAGQLIMTLRTGQEAYQAAFAPDGIHVITDATAEGTAIFTCKACQDFDHLLADVQGMVHRSLTADEKATYGVE